MIRKPTAFLIGVLAFMIGLAFYLQKNPVLQAGSETQIPSPTAAIRLLPGWQSTDIVAIDVKNAAVQAVSQTPEPAATAQATVKDLQLATDPQNQEGDWKLGTEDGGSVSLGKIEQIRTSLVNLQAVAVLPDDYSPEATGLVNPARVITLRSSQGKQVEIRVGGLTPTGTGYYVQVDQQAPLVIGKTSFDSIFEQLSWENLLDVTPAP